MLSAMLGAPRRTRELGSGTEYSGSMRSELRIETTVRASTRVLLSAGRGATAEASAGAARRGAGAAAGSVRGAAAATGSACGAVDAPTTLELLATSAGPGFVGAGTALADC